MPPVRTVHVVVATRILPLAAALLCALVFLAAIPAAAAVSAVPLGTAESFAVLAGAGITNTGATTITGDVGTFPTPAETGFGTVTLIGTNHAGDTVTQGAKVNLVTAYDDAFGRLPATNVPVELGGTTLLAGVYTSPTFGLTGTLTLDSGGDPNASFVFQAGSTLITATNSRVLLVGVDPCRVVWQVGSSATFGGGTSFAGDVLAQTSITAVTNASFLGRLLALDGAVTLDTNTITRPSCVAAAPGVTPSPAPTAAPSAPTTTTPPSTTTPTRMPSEAPDAFRPSEPLAAAPGAPPPLTGHPGATPGTPSNPPTLARTGLDTGGLTSAGLLLLGVGGVVLVARRGARKLSQRR
jgi:hypothetical protein